MLAGIGRASCWRELDGKLRLDSSTFSIAEHAVVSGGLLGALSGAGRSHAIINAIETDQLHSDLLDSMRQHLTCHGKPNSMKATGLDCG